MREAPGGPRRRSSRDERRFLFCERKEGGGRGGQTTRTPARGSARLQRKELPSVGRRDGALRLVGALRFLHAARRSYAWREDVRDDAAAAERDRRSPHGTRA